MTITASLTPIPIWPMINNTGTLAGGAKLYTRSSLNPTQNKAVYQDIGMTQPYTNPIIFNLNGTNGPFYWVKDSDNPDDNYYLEARDSDDNLLWTINNFTPPSSGSGGTTVTTYIPLVNFIANSALIDHMDDSANPIADTDLVIAPSNHKGFTPAQINPVVGTYGVVGPDIRFVKNNTNANDQITFVNFPLGSSALTGDVTPVQYVNYSCTNTPTLETYKCFQFPITQKVQNLSGKDMTFQIWAKVTSSSRDLNVYVRQYYGSAPTATAESASTRQVVGTISLSSNWQRFDVSFTMPSVAGNTLGTTNYQTDDDAVYIQLEMPMNGDCPCEVQFCKPALYLGTINPDVSFETYDQIDSVDQTPRTGDIRIGYSTTAPRGWLTMNEGSIGNVNSGATRRAASDTFQLYKLLWDSVSDTYAPVSGGRGANAITDFLADKRLTFPRVPGRALAFAGSGTGLTARSLGEYLGTETIAIADMPAHNHPGSVLSPASVGTFGGGGGEAYSHAGATMPLTIASQGGSAADGKMQPTAFFNVYIKL